ncbi:MAG TPA: PAS domain-containing protein [Verrucomicrobiae bacterium]
MSTATDSEFAVVLLTHDGTIVDAHPTCFDSLGWSREELAGKDVGELLQSDRELLMSQLLQTKDQEPGADGQTSFMLRILARRRDETTFPARVVVRRFDQTDICTVAFFRVTPYNDSDAPPIVRPEEIELAMRGNANRPAPAPADAKAEKPKSRWRNARLLFGSKTAPQPDATPAAKPLPPAPKPLSPAPAPLARTQPIAPVPSKLPAKIPANIPQRPRATFNFDPSVPDNIFLNNAPKPQPKPAPEAATEDATEPVAELSAPEPFVTEVPQEPEINLTESRQPLVEEVEEATHSGDEKPSYDALVREVEQEREERRRLEDRATELASQVSALHRQMGDNLDSESRNQKKVTTLEEQVRELRGQITNLKNEVASEREKNEAAQKRIEAANAVSTSLNEKLEALQLLHDTLGRTQVESENQLKAVNGDLKKAQEELAAETARRNDLEAQLTANKQQQLEQERALKLEISKLETALKAKDVEIKDAAAKNAQAQLQAAR